MQTSSGQPITSSHCVIITIQRHYHIACSRSVASPHPALFASLNENLHIFYCFLIREINWNIQFVVKPIYNIFSVNKTWILLEDYANFFPALIVWVGWLCLHSCLCGFSSFQHKETIRKKASDLNSVPSVLIKWSHGYHPVRLFFEREKMFMTKFHFSADGFMFLLINNRINRRDIKFFIMK